MHTQVVPILAAVAVTSMILTLLTHLVAHTVLWRSRRRPKQGPTPPISILKPLRGLDDGLEGNLRAMAQQDYPNFEILFAAEALDDPALEVARRVQRQHPWVPMRLLVSNEPDTLNPKVANLMAMTRRARHEYILVSDSNVRPGPGYLRAIAAETADENVALVSSVLAGSGGIHRGRFARKRSLEFVYPVGCLRVR